MNSNDGDKALGMNKLVSVAIDKDKGSQVALKWAVDNLLGKGHTVILIHVKVKNSGSTFSSSPPLPYTKSNHISDLDDEGKGGDLDPQTRELLLPFCCFCTRKDIQFHDVVLQDTDVVKAIVEYIAKSAINVLVLGAASKSGFFRFKAKDIPGSVSKGAPDFCTVYVISKGKILSTRSASRPAPSISPLHNQLSHHTSSRSSHSEPSIPPTPGFKVFPRPPTEHSKHSLHSDSSFKSPFTHRKGPNGKSYGELSTLDTDISFVSSGRPSTGHMFPSFSESFDMDAPSRFSNFSDMDSQSYESLPFGRRSVDTMTPPDVFFASIENDKSPTSQTMEEVEAEMRRLKLQLKQTMDMYSTACKEALSAKEKARELQRWKMEEQQRLDEARLAEESALQLAEREKARSRAALEHAEAAQMIAELEAQKRINAEMKALKEAEERSKVLSSMAHTDLRYRKYTTEEIEVATEYFSQSCKIGEGGYGLVYQCYLDHTPVAVKVLQPDATQGQSQFQQEVEVLSCIHHPNMVLLLGACPEYGCLVYEYMSNGSLEDRLFRSGNSPVIPWQHRFRIAAEIGTGLLFLHQAKPEPLVHRDLKPANILLDHNWVSKISDVGLARLVPPSVAENITQYRMTSAAGTFCYIDPEYQQTGMLGVKSDVYSLGVLYLQLVTARPPMGLTLHVERAIEKGTFAEMLDPAVSDWPVEEALTFSKLSLKCAELRRKDRPDLGKDIMPVLNRLREFAEGSMVPLMFSSPGPSPNNCQASMSQDGLSSTRYCFDSFGNQ